MQNLPQYQYTVVIEPDEGGYHAFVPALPGCHTFGLTIDETQTNIAEAIGLHLAAMRDDGEEIPIEREPMLVTRLSIPPAA